MKKRIAFELYAPWFIAQAIGFSLANYDLYRQSIYVAQNIYWTEVGKVSSFVENSNNPL
jgi:hypothetical protein